MFFEIVEMFLKRFADRAERSETEAHGHFGHILEHLST